MVQEGCPTAWARGLVDLLLLKDSRLKAMELLRVTELLRDTVLLKVTAATHAVPLLDLPDTARRGLRAVEVAAAAAAAGGYPFELRRLATSLSSLASSTAICTLLHFVSLLSMVCLILTTGSS